jgi:signal transduction histidine kinase
LWPILVANFLLVAANVIFFIGVAEFLKRPKLVPLWAVVLVIYGVGFGYFWVSDTPLGVRYLLIGPVGALISSMTLWYLCSGMTAEDALGRKLASAFQILLLLFSVMVTLGGLFILIGDFPSTGQDSLLKTKALGFGIALHMIGLTGFSLALVTMVLQRALADTNRAMETVFSANQTKSDFLSAMSHNLRTPLNAILGFSDMMRSEIYGPLGARKYSEYANDIHGSGSQLLMMVNNILDLTKVEAGEYRLNEEEVDIGVTLGFCIRQVEPMKSPSRQDMLLEIPETAPKLWADERLLTQIFGNILSNAAKFTPEDGKITISASVEATRGVIVSISDNGHGIPQEDIESVLQPF